MALLNKLIVVVLALGFVHPSSQRVVTPVTMFDVSLLMFDDFGSEMKKTYDAISKGVDFAELWRDLKKHPGDYASSAFSTTAMGVYAGVRRMSPWAAATGGAAGAASGILGHYIITHNFKKEEKRPVRKKLAPK